VRPPRRQRTRRLVPQLGYASRTLLSAAPPSGLEDRLGSYARALSSTPCEIEHFKWRNGFWYDYSQLALKNKFDDPTPLHTEYVQYCIDQGIIKGPLDA
jgi:hypothetical protein